MPDSKGCYLSLRTGVTFLSRLYTKQDLEEGAYWIRDNDPQVGFLSPIFRFGKMGEQEGVDKEMSIPAGLG
jgi:hypothetical protein